MITKVIDAFKLISIIIPVKNNSVNLDKCLMSIIDMQNEYIEIIIVDGQSTDSIDKVIYKYNSYISIFISEPDTGIYDAMNKGIALARGNYILFLGADDKLLNIPLKFLLKLKDSSAIITCPVKYSNGLLFKPMPLLIPFINTMHHQGTFYPADLLKRNLFDLNYSVFSDFNSNQIFYKNRVNIITLRVLPVALHSMGGISSNEKYKNEPLLIVLKNYNWSFVLISYFIRKIRAFLRIKIMRKI